MATNPKRYYLIRTPGDRHRPLKHGSDVRFEKRTAIQVAKLFARDQRWKYLTPVRNRRISVYVVDPGKRPSLLYQCHIDRKTGRIVSEEL